MILTLTGTVAEKLNELVVLDVAGVGYGMITTLEEQGKLILGQETKMYVHEHIRENSYDLYGFCSLETKNLFEQLLDVSGVGPKVAIAIVGLGSASEVRQAIASGDIKFIQSASGVGRKVAERVVVELKDKVGLVGADVSGLLQSERSLIQDEAVEALVALGYAPHDAAAALQKVDPELPTEERVKEALKSGTK